MGWLIKGLIFTIILLLVATVGVFSVGDKNLPASVLGGLDKSSPSDWVNENQIKVYKDKIVLDISDATWASFANTKSMDPVFDADANAIEILPEDPQSINVGDVISYRTSYGTLIHRVVEKGVDEQGVYYYVKADNSSLRDPFKVRYSDVKGVVVAIIY